MSPRPPAVLLDDDEEIQEEIITDFKSPHKDGRDHEQGGAPLVCPECFEPFPKPEDLGRHLVRHEPVGSGPKYSEPTKRGKIKLLSVKCPKGCGRWFDTKPMGNYRAHVAMCNGESPILATGSKEDKAMPKFECKTHDFKTTNPRSWGQHQRNHHKGDRSPGATRTPAARPPAPAPAPAPRPLTPPPVVTPPGDPRATALPASAIPAAEPKKPDGWYSMIASQVNARKADLKAKYDADLAAMDAVVENLKKLGANPQ